jgi:kumamolisin
MVLRRRPDAPPLPDMEHWATTPPGRRRFLSREEFATRHGASDQDVNQATRFANRHGLTISETHLARRTVELLGTIGQINVAFGITLAMYEPARESYRSYDGPIHLPAEVREIVLAVFGLDTRRLARRAGGPALTITPLTPPNVAALYGFPTVPSSISGQTIGLFEFGGGYAVNAASQPVDVAAFLQGLNPPLPTPTVIPVPVAGGTNTVLGGPGWAPAKPPHFTPH